MSAPPTAQTAQPEPAQAGTRDEPAAVLDEDTRVVAVDPVLLEILGTEVGGHLDTVDAWLAQARTGAARRQRCAAAGDPHDQRCLRDDRSAVGHRVHRACRSLRQAPARCRTRSPARRRRGAGRGSRRGARLDPRAAGKPRAGARVRGAGGTDGGTARRLARSQPALHRNRIDCANGDAEAARLGRRAQPKPSVWPRKKRRVWKPNASPRRKPRPRAWPPSMPKPNVWPRKRLRAWKPNALPRGSRSGAPGGRASRSRTSGRGSRRTSGSRTHCRGGSRGCTRGRRAGGSRASGR